MHARGGARAVYQPVQSVLTPERDGDPLLLARRFRQRLAVERCYVADLDALTGGARQLDLLRQLVRPEHGFGPGLMVDAAIHDAESARSLLDLGATTVIIALESLPGPRALEHLIRSLEPGALLLSLDLRGGRPVTRAGADWEGGHDPLALARTLARTGLGRLLILDVALVGKNEGPPFETILAIHSALPELDLLAGGGVRHEADLARLEQLGVSAALVATALHDGRLAGYIATR